MKLNIGLWLIDKRLFGSSYPSIQTCCSHFLLLLCIYLFDYFLFRHLRVLLSVFKINCCYHHSHCHGVTTNCGNLARLSKIRARAGKRPPRPSALEQTSQPRSKFLFIHLFIYFYPHDTSNRRQRCPHRTSADLQPECRLAVSHRKQLRQCAKAEVAHLRTSVATPEVRRVHRRANRSSPQVPPLIFSAYRDLSLQPSPLPSLHFRFH